MIRICYTIFFQLKKGTTATTTNSHLFSHLSYTIYLLVRAFYHEGRLWCRKSSANKCLGVWCHSPWSAILFWPTTALCNVRWQIHLPLFPYLSVRALSLGVGPRTAPNVLKIVFHSSWILCHLNPLALFAAAPPDRRVCPMDFPCQFTRHDWIMAPGLDCIIYADEEMKTRESSNFLKSSQLESSAKTRALIPSSWFSLAWCLCCSALVHKEGLSVLVTAHCTSLSSPLGFIKSPSAWFPWRSMYWAQNLGLSFHFLSTPSCTSRQPIIISMFDDRTGMSGLPQRVILVSAKDLGNSQIL